MFQWVIRCERFSSVSVSMKRSPTPVTPTEGSSRVKISGFKYLVSTLAFCMNCCTMVEKASIREVSYRGLRPMLRQIRVSSSKGPVTHTRYLIQSSSSSWHRLFACCFKPMSSAIWAWLGGS